jgi:hypothetical protein
MVEKKDSLTDLGKTRGGLVEALLLPYLDMQDIVRLAASNKFWRKYLDPLHGYHVNWSKLVLSRLQLTNEDPNFERVSDQLADVSKFKAVLEIYAENLTKLVKWPGDPRGFTYSRYNKKLRCREWLAYGGKNGTMNNEPQYFTHGKYDSALFNNLSVITLKSVCWMNPCSLFE